MVAILIFLFALVLRLILAPLAFHIDILSNAGWGQWIFLHGPLGFYENGIWIFSWPTQPPFVSLLYGFDHWLYIFLLETFRSIGNTIVQYHLAPNHLRFCFSFTKWFDIAKVSDESVFTTGYLTTIKLPAILADLGIAGLIYYLAKQIKEIKYPILWASLYLFSPFSWYLSSLWGQYDQLAFLPVFLALILESKKKLSWLTPLLFALGIAIKPTALILLPIFIYIYFKNSPKKFFIIISAILIISFFFATTQVFTNQNVIDFTRNTLVAKIFFKAASRLSANAFNFWRILMAYGSETAEAKFLFIPASIWSDIAFVILNILAFKKVKEINLKNVFIGAFIVSAGSWLFMTNMLDRYFFAGIVTGLVLCLFDKRLVKYWLPMSIIFALNLYNQWFFPPFLDPIRFAFEWQGGIITKLLSLTNVLLFVKMLSLIV